MVSEIYSGHLCAHLEWKNEVVFRLRHGRWLRYAQSSLQRYGQNVHCDMEKRNYIFISSFIWFTAEPNLFSLALL